MKTTFALFSPCNNILQSTAELMGYENTFKNYSTTTNRENSLKVILKGYIPTGGYCKIMKKCLRLNFFSFWRYSRIKFFNFFRKCVKISGWNENNLLFHIWRDWNFASLTYKLLSYCQTETSMPSMRCQVKITLKLMQLCLNRRSKNSLPTH